MRRLLAVLVLLSGCDLYWNNGDDDCEYYATAGAELSQPANQLRNPETGDCEYFGGGGGYCNDPCAPCAAEDQGAPRPDPDWAQCYGQCNGLTESSCISTSGCQATYDSTITAGNASPTNTFSGCVGTAPSGPISTGSCTNLTSSQCNQHDNCAAYYLPNGGNFDRCAPESGGSACTNVDCGPGYHCEDQCKDTCGPGGDCGPQCGSMCVPDGNVCDNVDCGAGYSCVETCTTPTPTHNGQCFASCQPTTSCEALTTEAACAGRGDCTTVYLGDDCTCTPGGGCTCEVLTYDHCETL